MPLPSLTYPVCSRRLGFERFWLFGYSTICRSSMMAFPKDMTRSNSGSMTTAKTSSKIYSLMPLVRY